MTKLASKQDVLDLLSIRTTTQSQEAIDAALEIATSKAEGILGTEFKRRVRLDRYWVDREHYDALYTQKFPVKFFLQDGFLPEARARVYASTARILRTTSSAVTVDKSYYIIDAKDGALILTGLPLSGMNSLAIRYECGFNESGGVYQDVPQWLKSAVISGCIEVLRTHAITFNKKDDIQDMSNQIVRALRTNLYPHVRERYGGVFPMHSEVL